MKRSIHRWRLAGGVALVAVIASATLQAQEPPKPTKEHEELKSEVGAWDAEVSMWMSPDAEPIKSKAVETNEMFEAGPELAGPVSHPESQPAPGPEGRVPADWARTLRR